jgi:hypothetical protein
VQHSTFSDKPIYATNNFYALYSDVKEDLWLYLNSAVFRMFMELYGRTEGAGALQLQVYEYKQCPVPFPHPNISAKFRMLERFRSRTAYKFINIAEHAPLEFDQPDRRELDELVLQELGFSDPEERKKALDEMYQWLQERVRERLTKPMTAPESVSKLIRKKTQQLDLREF